MALSREFRTLALKLQEAAGDLSHSDICRTLTDCLRDSHPASYCYVADVYGDADSGDVVYCCGSDYMRAPYEISSTNGKRTASIAIDSATSVLPRTVYDEEADDDDQYAGMEERFPGALEDGLIGLSERYISKDERDAADAGDFAGSGRSFPILKPGDVMAAVRSIGRGVAGGQSATSLKNKIKAIAKRKGWTKYLPKAWQSDKKDESVRWAPDGVLLIEGASFLESPKLQEAAMLDYPIKLIAPGRGTSGYYPPTTLKQAAEAKVFKAGTQMFWNHDTDAEESARPEGDLNRLAAVTTTDATWDEAGRDGPGLYARAKVFSDYADKVREKGPHIGLSIRAGGMREDATKAPDGKPGVITQLNNAMSVDFVTRAGRDGKIFTEAATSESTAGDSMDKSEVLALIETAVAPVRTKLTEAETENKRLRQQLARQQAPGIIREALKDIRLPDASKNKIIARLAEAELPEDSKQLTELIESEAKSEARFLQELGYNVAGFGARMSEKEAQEQAAKHGKQHEKAYKEAQKTLCDLFVGPKLAEGEASPELVAKRAAARKAFKEGRAA